MRILGVYLSRIFLLNFALGLALMVLLFVTQELLRQLTGDPYPAFQIIRYNLLTIPEVASNLAPPAVMFGTLLTLTQLGRSGELVALYSIGFTERRLVTLFLGWVVLICGVLLTAQDRWVPAVFRVRTNYYWREMKGKTDFFLDAKRSKVWYRSGNSIYNIDVFDPQLQTLYGMSIYTLDDEFRLVQVIQAKRAIHHAPPQGPSPEKAVTYWTLHDGTLTVFDTVKGVRDPIPTTLTFESKELRISETPKDFQEIEREVDGLRISELRAYIQKAKRTGMDTRVYETKYQSRFSLSAIPIVMCLLALPFGRRNRREGGMARDVGLCLAITFLYWLIMTIGLSLGKSGTIQPWLGAWGPTLIAGFFASLLLARKP